MEEHFVSEPMDFNYKNGNHVDFAKTFDLTGSDNDQMLKYYLRKAGLSDNIEYLTSEQRRAFIYDIVKSNKNPGHWKPSVLPQAPPKVQRESSMTVDSISDIPPASSTFDLASYRRHKNEHSNLNKIQTIPRPEQNVKGTLYERQFSQKHNEPKKVPIGPPIPLTTTTTLRTRKGKLVEISSPKNFQHVAGDMTRDMTKNTFDLSGNFNNNSLKKYMIERGITEEDVAWLDRKDLIRRIVQSNYTWMPRKQHSGNKVPPPPSERFVAAMPTPPSTQRNISHSKGGAIVVAPPALPETLTSSSENIYEEIIQPKRTTTSIRRPRRKPLSPPPPPPVAVNSAPNDERVTSTVIASCAMAIEQTPKAQNCASPPPPPPPPPPPLPTMSIEKTVEPKIVPVPPSPSPPSMPIEKTKSVPTPPPPPPMMPIERSQRTENVPPPPPPPPASFNTSNPKNNTESKPQKQLNLNQTAGEDGRNELLKSIRGGVTLKKVSNQDKQLKSSSLGTLNVRKEPQQLKDLGMTSEQADVQPVKAGKPDFMTELRNATLKRVKKLENNPYSAESEC